MKLAAFYGFWLAIAIAAAIALARVHEDYRSTVVSLQDFQWSVAAFEPATPLSATTSLVLTVQNPSSAGVEFKDLEVYLWLNGYSVGKTYTHVDARTVPPRSSAQVPLTIVIDAASLAARIRAGGGAMLWRATGTYKARTPFSGGDFNYQLSLDVGS